MVLDPARIGRRNPALTGAHWLIGAAVTLAVALVATLLTIVFAATMAVAAVVIGAVLSVWAMAVRLRRGRRLQPSQPMIIEAHKVGHAWVAYGWDQPAPH